MDTDVLVVGAGPCGVTMANLLGVYGVRATIIDRDTGILDFPRAVGVDDESLRTFQAVGLVQPLLADILQNMPIRYYTSWGRCFAHVKPSAQPFGWPRRNLFLQPLFEATLRKGLERFANVETRYGEELTGFEQDGDGVTAQVRAADGQARTVRAQFLVGADGGRSTVRGLAGIELTGKTAPVKWLVVDVAEDTLYAPYSAVHCHPTRPVLTIPLPYRHRRFEFRVQPGDDEEALVDHDNVRKLLAPHYRGLSMPNVVRARVYLHHSRTAATFQRGRVFLIGDAAHLQPPFFGQGMNSGIRDATNLAWKLAAVVSGRAGESMLRSYDSERRGHAAEMVGFATRVGSMYTPRNRATERARDVGFRLLQLVPGGREYILQMKYKPMPRYRDGVLTGLGERGKDNPVGQMFGQPPVETAARERTKLDEVLGPWFAVIGVHVDPAAALSERTREWWRALGARFVHVEAPRTGPRPALAGQRTPLASGDSESVVVEDVDGAFRDWLLAHSGDEVIVLRPDRYVAALTDRAGFEATTATLRGLLGAGEKKAVAVAS